MKKRCAWLVLVPALLGLCACNSTSEAKVNVTNSGLLPVKVTISYDTSTLASGVSDTFTLTWPGHGSMRVSMSYYPIGQPLRTRYEELDLQDGDVLTFDVGFAG